MKNHCRLLTPLVLLMLLAACTSDSLRKPDVESSSEINARLGLAYMQQGYLEIALERLQRAIEQDPQQVTAHHYIAELYRQLKSPDDASVHYQLALQLTPEDFSLHNNYGVFLCEQKDYEAAEKSFLMAISTAPIYKPRHEFYENLAQCMMQSIDYTKAEKYFRIVLETHPRMPVTLYQMARLTFEAKKYLRARAFFQRFTEVSTQTAETLWLGIQIERQLGDERTAGEYIRQLKTNFPLATETVTLMESE